MHSTWSHNGPTTLLVIPWSFVLCCGTRSPLLLGKLIVVLTLKRLYFGIFGVLTLLNSKLARTLFWSQGLAGPVILPQKLTNIEVSLKHSIELLPVYHDVQFLVNMERLCRPISRVGDRTEMKGWCCHFSSALLKFFIANSTCCTPPHLHMYGPRM